MKPVSHDQLPLRTGRINVHQRLDVRVLVNNQEVVYTGSKQAAELSIGSIK